MKKLNVFRILAITIIATIGLISCSKENANDKVISENAKVAPFLKSFYKKDFKLGQAVNTKVANAISATSKSTDVEDLVITEVFVGDDTRARGYVITSKTTNVFLYFVDVDRVDYKMTKVDIVANDIVTFEDIEQMDNYISTNQFDFIKVAQDVLIGNGQAGNLSRIRYSYGACRDGWCGVYQATFFLGIQWTDWEPVRNENGVPLTVSC
jgi:hypothetical protein